MAKREEAAGADRPFGFEALKFVLTCTFAAAVTFGLQYKSWNEEEKLSSAKNTYDKAYQAVIDFSELYHKRYFAFKRVYDDYELTGRASDLNKARYYELFYEWNYKIDTFIKQFEFLIDKPYYESLTRYDTSVLLITGEQLRNIDCADLFGGANGFSPITTKAPKWTLVKFYPRAFDHCFTKTRIVVDGMVNGVKVIRPSQAFKIYDQSYYSMNIFRNEALRRLDCNYNERKTNNFFNFIGLLKKDLARTIPSCQVARSQIEAKSLRDASKAAPVLVPPRPPAPPAPAP